MITKAEIQSIDYAGNTCYVRIPYFESAGSNKIFAQAIFSNSPGTYNGYREGDIVMVAFEDGNADTPCVIGKLYLGANIEKQTSRGVINCEAITASSTNSLPIDTKITSDKDNNKIIADGTATTFTTLKSALEAISNNAKNISLLSNTAQNLTIGTILCIDPVTNLYGYTAAGFTAEKTTIDDKTYYKIKLNNNETLTELQVKNYMKYMTGAEILPSSYDEKAYSGAFLTISQQIYTPIWESASGSLKLLIIKE